ncbi:hypothetical protein PSm6_52200 [Pseudomonas solani]|uniref:Secreted protein n=1 Tax=Pseudomonas solani TaxID=2731552 RepID=A0ABM7LGX4_9PSED|nr:hypothetical protein PSm6_52200 [Pseudomonas solani]
MRGFVFCGVEAGEEGLVLLLQPLVAAGTDEKHVSPPVSEWNCLYLSVFVPAPAARSHWAAGGCGHIDLLSG